MVVIFVKAHICQGNTQVHLQFFFANQNFSRHRKTELLRKWIQLLRSSTSSEISFQGLPSKSKRLSIRKQIASSLSSQLLVLVFTKHHLQRGIQQTFFRQYFCERLEKRIKLCSEKFKKVHKKTPVAKSYVSKVAGFFRSSHRMRSVKRCSQKGVRKIHRKRPVSETLF